MNTHIFNVTKREVILSIIFLILGIILGLIIFNGASILQPQDKSATKEITILNKEINNCIDKLNICENNINLNKPLN